MNSHEAKTVISQRSLGRRGTVTQAIRTRTWLVAVGVVLALAGPVDAVSAAPPVLAARFEAPTPAAGSTVTTRAVSMAFSYNRAPAQTRLLRCTLAGPTPSTKACSAPVRAGAGRSRSGVGYSGLADGAYTFTAVVRLKSGARVSISRRFSVNATPVVATQTLFPVHADYWQNSSGRYLNVEAVTTRGGVTGGSYSGPSLSASWRDAAGNVIGSGALSPFVDDATYVRHRTRFRLGSTGTGGMPASVRVTSSDGQSTTLAVTPWIGAPPPPHVAGYFQGLVSGYSDPRAQRDQLDALAAQWPDLVSVVNLPEKTTGYQRKAQAIVGVSAGPGQAPSAAEEAGAIVVTSRAFGHEGGNQLAVRLNNVFFPSQPLTVSVVGNLVAVNLATDDGGNPSSTASHVVAALNATPAFNAVATASTYRGNAGGGVPLPTPGYVALDDFLHGPDTVDGPFQQHLYRIGKVRDGSKVGVLVYCQESGREWVTPLVCTETAERLVRNYATDPQTQALLNDVEVFIVPSVNPDGALYSIYDASGHSTTMSPCAAGTDPANRDTLGVSVARNFATGSRFDGFAGASSTCGAATYSGPSEYSEPETRNLAWVMSTFPNIRFAANVSSGGSVTWAPGAYQEPGRTTLPNPSPGVAGYFRQTAQRIVTGVNADRGTTIDAGRVAPGVDVQGSEAGNSTDTAWYEHGIFAFDLGTGVPRPTSTTSDATVDPGVQPCFAGVGSGGEEGFCPADGSLANEGFHETMEFADGVYELLQAAFDYAHDVTAPAVGITVQRPQGSGTAVVTFDADDAADVYYTTDGSAPTLASTRWTPPVPGAARPPLVITQATTLRWIAADVKGNVAAAQSATITP